tara:strand:- start:2553 stop:4298 length:1746 start_codon:yes stop_codon:yes gene_type:complete
MPYQNLTEEQLDAVKFNDDLLLSACPGSGKTRALVSKIYHLLDNAESLSIGKRKVIAITYTNIAADTITERLLSYGVESSRLWIGTIHSFCLQWIIRPNINKIPRLCGGFVVIDELEKEAKLTELKAAYGFETYDSINTALNRSYKPCYSRDKPEYKLVNDYHKFLSENGYIDFDLILNISYRVLELNPQLCQRLGKLLYHLLIDEYQDTSEMQYEILKLIILKKSTKITLIGDKDQAIYTGMGAIVKNKAELVDFFELDNGIVEKRLTGCFRSSQRIVDYYLTYQDDPYNVVSKSEFCDFPSVVHSDNTIDRTQLVTYITSIVETHLKQGISAKDIAILCPSWFDVINLSTGIEAVSKTFEIDGFLISPIPKNQDNIWLPLIRLMLIRPDIRNYIKRRRLAYELSEGLYVANCLAEPIEPKLILRTLNSLEISTDMEIEEWIISAIDNFCLILGMNESSTAQKGKNSLVQATKERMHKYSMVYRASDLKSFFVSSHGVKITTSHSTKGDEYEVVICTGLLEGKVPNWNDVIGCNIEHQNYVARRLLYVIASRAKKHLYMISERGHKTKGGYSYKTTRQLT